ncbi:hypothetical protein N7507_004971 [Penicillium longicatenatum]|nr:hypothetical protein N7507_004971 [Penicillium longicatenatum]
MPNTFAKVVASTAGKFEDAGKIPEWIRKHGGTFSRKVDSQTTHLIVTAEAYKKNVEAVQTAKDLGTVHIVESDWLYDSLQQKKPRPRDPKPYLWARILEAELKPRKKQKVAATPKSPRQPPMNKNTTSLLAAVPDPFVQAKVTKKKPVRASKKTDALSKDKIYIDESTNQAWDATLTRTLQSLKREKFRLAIFQSNETPPTFSAYVKYSRIGTSNISILAPPKSCFTLAKAGFESFFLLQTGVEWRERMNLTLRFPKKDNKGDVLPSHEGWYTFEAESIMTAYMKGPSKPCATPEEAHATANVNDSTKSDGFTLVDKEDYIAAGLDSGNEGDVESLKSVSTLSALQDVPGEQIDNYDVENIKKDALALLESVTDDEVGYGHGLSKKRKALSMLDPAPREQTDDDAESSNSSMPDLCNFPPSEPDDYIDGDVESLNSSSTALGSISGEKGENVASDEVNIYYDFEVERLKYPADDEDDQRP